MYKEYEYVIIGAGIAGSSTAYFLSEYSDSILLIDRNCDIAQGASGAAGAFLSPLLGKPNKFKELITSALKFSTSFYKDNILNEITNCGVVRIPKNNENREKFESYKPYMDFEYEEEGEGYFFKIGSQINSYETCRFLAKDVEKLFNYEAEHIKKEGEFWLINDEIKAKKLILTTGADTSLIDEKYFNIRAVWGQKIDIYTTTCIDVNYHKECSLSISRFDEEKKKYKVSIGATHHRFNCDMKVCNHCIKTSNINKMFSHSYGESTVNNDTKKLLKLANEIKNLEDVEICDIKIGPRASSTDYFPMVGKLINSKTTIKKFPHLVNGSHVKNEMLSSYDNLFVLNGVGGRGFVLSPYLAKNLVEHIIKNNNLEETILTHRLFKRWVKKNS
ncbi:MAG: D-amino-acid oxidase [Arcobacter sp.]|nr:MAG: D-amino-acid oxidase [Arcobacter sp.]